MRLQAEERGIGALLDLLGIRSERQISRGLGRGGRRPTVAVRMTDAMRQLRFRFEVQRRLTRQNADEIELHIGRVVPERAELEHGVGIGEFKIEREIEKRFDREIRPVQRARARPIFRH